MCNFWQGKIIMILKNSGYIFLYVLSVHSFVFTMEKLEDPEKKIAQGKLHAIKIFLEEKRNGAEADWGKFTSEQNENIIDHLQQDHFNDILNLFNNNKKALNQFYSKPSIINDLNYDINIAVTFYILFKHVKDKKFGTREPDDSKDDGAVNENKLLQFQKQQLEIQKGMIIQFADLSTTFFTHANNRLSQSLEQALNDLQKAKSKNFQKPSEKTTPSQWQRNLSFLIIFALAGYIGKLHYY
jgi:hypothetical protein